MKAISQNAKSLISLWLGTGFIVFGPAAACGAVIYQSFARPLAPNIQRGEGNQTDLLFEGKAVVFQWRLAPYTVDLDGNNTGDLTFVHKVEPTDGSDTMNVSLAGRNQIWANARGITGRYRASFALALVAGIEIGPSLFSNDPRIGWHNDDDLIEPSNLVSAIGNNPSFTRKNLGFRFERDGALHYAWMEISGRYNYSGGDVFIHAWAWESEPGKGILVGAIPEPGVGWLLLLGAWLGLRRGRGAWDVPLKWVG